MAIIGKTQRDLRRRRALVEENTESTIAADNDRPQVANHQKNRYTEAAFAENLPTITDFLPKRPWLLFTYGLLGLTVVTLFTLFDYFELSKSVRISTALSILHPQSFAAWFVSALLGFVAVLSIFLFWLRRQRIDDYKARYRIWIPVAVLSILTSIDCTTAIGSVARNTLSAKLSSMPWAQQLLIWLPSLVCLYLGIRLFFEVRSSRLASFWLTIAALSFTCFVAVSNISAIKLPHELTIAGSSWLLASVAISLSLTAFTRFVFLDAQGQLAVRQTKSKKQVRKDKAAIKKAPVKEADTPKAEGNVTAKEPLKAKRNSAKKKVKAAESATPQKTPSEETPVAKKGLLSRWRKKSTAEKTSDSVVNEPAESVDKPQTSQPKTRKTAQAQAERSTEETESSRPLSRKRKSRNSKVETGTSQVAKKESTQTSASHHEDELDYEDLLETPHANLSKSERKRLRKEKRRRSRAA